jgi:hypothetical protein
MKKIGFYNDPKLVGYIGWIETIDSIYFIDIGGGENK